MPLRQPAPDLPALIQQVSGGSSVKLVELMTTPAPDDTRYQHWSEIYYRPVPEGMTHEEWWVRLKLARHGQRRPVPLYQISGAPFTISLTDEVLRLSEEVASRSGGRLGTEAGGVPSARSRERYIARSLAEEAITSSQLEGASTSRRVAVELLRTGREPRDVSERMIRNNYRAMRFARERKDSPLDQDMVCDLHRILTEGTLDNPADEGRIETPEDHRVQVWAQDTSVHVPPPAAELPKRLAQLCAFANAESSSSPYIPPVIRAIISHFMFGYDHYFADGNGRTARTVFYWSMLRSGYWLTEYIAISRILRRAQGKYGESYEFTEDDEGDLTYFVLHQLKVVIRALDELDQYLDDRQTETAQVDSALKAAGAHFNFRQTQIVEWLVRDTISTVSASEIATKYGVTTQTARTDLGALTDRGILMLGAGRRPKQWIPAPDLKARLEGLGS
ncbi:Fic family protein [Mycetocola saprophilus]|uniref:Fic family protein n=1 Tax=Mycetocola saprophilus TaxID=76636 RepID=UPI0004BF905B|nr:Fic family protein [Mycetocola saprophilus]